MYPRADMSGNQKQASGVVPQSQSSFAQGPFIPSRPPTPQRTDGFHVTTPPTFVPQQPPNQGNNQGPGLRSMAPTGPPTQASTPPNTDLKVQQMPQGASVNLSAYMTQTAQVRATSQNFYPRAPPPQNQTPRIPNHRQGQQTMFPSTPQMQHVPILMQHVYPNPNLPFQFSQRPTTSYVQQYQPISGQTISTYPYPQAQNQQLFAYAYQPIVQRQGPPPPVPAAPQNHTQANPSAMVLPQNSQQTVMQPKNRRRTNAIPIIDPYTGEDKLNEIYEQQNQDDSHPASGESSACQTPQPSVPNTNKDVQAAFAQQVAQAINSDGTSSSTSSSVVHQQHHHHHHPHLESDHHYSHPPHHPSSQQQHLHQQQQQQQQQQHTQPPPPQQQQQQPPHHRQSTTPSSEYVPYQPQQQQQQPPSHQHHQPPQHTHTHSPPGGTTMLQTNVSNHHQAVQNNGRIEHIVQTSSMKVQAKEFIPQTAKEVTPVVSALTDSEEVTIPKQPPKDRESPVKSRKQQQGHREPKEQPAPPKDAFICEKPPAIAAVSSAVKEESSSKQGTRDTPAGSGDAAGNSTFVANQQQQQQHVTLTSSGKQQQQQQQQQPHEVEKKSSKKDKSSSQVTISVSEATDPAVSTTAATSSVSSLPTEISTTTVNAKSKHNAAQRSKEAQKQQSNNHQQLIGSGGGFAPASTNSNVNKPSQTATALPVPQSQPAKANNKTNRTRELNQKGNLKEGSEMDAFSDDSVPVVLPNNVVSKNGNAKTPLSTSDVADLVNTSTTVIIENSKITNEKLDASASSTVNNHVSTYITSPLSAPPTSAPTTTTMIPPKPVVDVTSIVATMAPPPVAYTAPVESANATTFSRDEPDRSAVINDKLVQARNKANRTSPVTLDHNNVIDTKNNSVFKEALTRDGKRVYSLEELCSLRDSPGSKKLPDHFKIPPDLLANGDDRGRISDNMRYNIGGRSTTDFAPSFSSGGGTYPGRGSSHRGLAVKRNSQSGKPKGANMGGKQSVIKVSISVKEDVKLHETENAWRPARFTAGANMTEDDKKTEQLYRKVRGILNKLTPQKFKTLVSQIKGLTIDTCERLQGVIDLVFEKAVDEPNFSVAYALLCKELALMQVPYKEESKKDDFVNFRKLLVTRCQQEFEKNSIDEEERNKKMKEIEECPDPEKKKELLLELEEYDRQLRMKSVGNTRFIGELYKQNMLTSNIMYRCITNLLDDKNEESLECLCKLLSTIGQELEAKAVDLNPFFNTMKEIVDKKHGKISSRVRFMLQDVIDLRNAKWVPRRQDMKPKTIDQIQKEAESEHMATQALNALSMPKREDRGLSSGGSEKKRRNITDEGGWSTRRSYLNISSDKLKNRTPTFNEPLGPSNTFDNWSKGSGVKSGVTPVPPSNNIYTALETLGDSDKSSLPWNKDSYSNKSTIERLGNKYDDGRSSRSSSQHRSRDSSATSQRSTGVAGGRGSTSTVAATPQMPSLTKGQSAPPPVTAEPVEPVITPDQLERRLKNILDEYLNDCSSLSDCDEEIRTKIPKSTYATLVSNSYNNVLERSKTARMRTGLLFAHLIKRNTLPFDDYCKGLEEVLSFAEDLVIDIPKIWDYFAEVIVPLITEELMSFKVLHKCSSLLITQDHMPKLLASLFKLIIEEKGPAFLQNHWRESRLSLEDFLLNTDVNKFVSETNVEFLLDTSGNVPAYKPSITFDEIREKLLLFFNANTSFDDVMKWIDTNVGEAIKEGEFIRALMTAILERSIVGNKLKEDDFKAYYNYLHRFVTGSTVNSDLHCLNAVQSLLNKMEYPQGLLLAIFETLYEDTIVPYETFISWESSTDPAEQAGKGVALKQLTSFFTNLREADDETESSSSEEA